MSPAEQAPRLAALQHGFADALLQGGDAVPAGVTSHTAPRPVRRFQVYRNNVFASLIEVVRARFPVVERLVGEEFFRAMARVFVSHASGDLSVAEMIARWLRDARDSGDELEDTGYVEDADGDGFRYLRTAGAIRRGRY